MPGTKSSFDIVFIPFIALIIISLACFNYIILSIANSLKRSKEIGLRKVFGAKRTQIISLFLCESFVVTFIALIIAGLIIFWLIPVFNQMEVVARTEQINVEQMKSPGIYILFILFAVIVSIAAGINPALYLSSFFPVKALKGPSEIKGKSRFLSRKILMGIQFGVSLIAIIFIIYFYQLYSYWMNYDRGIKTENFVSVTLRDVNYQTFKNEVSSNSNIIGVTSTTPVPIFGAGYILSLRTEEMDEPHHSFLYQVDHEFIKLFDLKLIAGRNFSTDFSTDEDRAIIINEKTVKVFNLKSPKDAIGKTFLISDSSEVVIIGVVKDFFYKKHFDNSIEPLVFRCSPERSIYATISYLPGKKEVIESYLKDTWEKFDKIHPVSCIFFDEEQKKLEKSITGPMKISACSAIFVLLIALLGLFGMATYTSEIRTKEIGVRKVMGAEVFSITYLLSKNYIKLILYAALFAVPAAYFLTKTMFQFFPIRPVLSFWVLPAALIFVIIVALIAISSQIFKAAIKNPVKTLSYE